MAKLRRRRTSAPGVLDEMVSMVILRLSKYGQNYKRVDSAQNCSSGLTNRHWPGDKGPKEILPMRTRFSPQTLRPTISHMRRI